jgi:uncharacterized protein (TIGR02246 family)
MPAPAADAGPTVTTTVPDFLQSTWSGLMAAWNGEDPGAVAAYYAEDAVVTTPEGEIRGRAAIRDQWIAPNLQQTSAVNVTPSRFEVRANDMTEEGSYTITIVDGTSQSGAYSHHWIRLPDGSWKVHMMSVT